MPNVTYVENPRRPKKSSQRRTLTAAQRAAGFGGRAAMSRKANPRRRSKSHTKWGRVKSHTRRVNPTLAAWAVNPRRRRRRNPGLLSGLPGLPGLNLKAVAFTAGGAIITRMAPALIEKVWPGVPRTGLMGHAVKIGAAFALSMGVKAVMKDTAAANQVLIGGLAVAVMDIYDEYVAPKLGLTGLSGFVNQGEIFAVENMSGFVNQFDDGQNYAA